MKKITFVIILLCLSLMGLTQTLPNAGFENWISNPTPPYDDPESWNTPNPLTSLTGVVVVNKSDDAYSGSYSAELTTKKLEIGDVTYIAPGLVTYAKFNVNTETLEYTFSGGLYMPESIKSLSGMYKFSSDGNDSATVLIYSFSHPEGEDIDTISAGAMFLHDTNEWTSFTVPMFFFNYHQPDTFNVLLMSTATFDMEIMPVGAVLKVDELSIVTNTGIFDLNIKNVELHVFPNPASDYIVFETTQQEKDRKLNIFDMSGKLIRQMDFNHERLQVNLAGLSAGNYSYRVFAGRQLYNSGTFIIK